MGWQHDARNAGPTQGIRFLDAEMGLLAIWVDIQRWLSIRPTIRRLGRAHGANLRPGLTVREGPRWVHGAPRGSHVRGPYGPIVHHWPILIGPMWAALCATLVGTTCGPYGLPVWGPNGSMVGLRWVPCAWSVWAPGGPLANSVWVPQLCLFHICTSCVMSVLLVV